VPAAASVCGACLREPPPWSRTVAACDYGYPWDGLLTALKFHAALDLVPARAARLAHQADASGAMPVDTLLPVPLADARLRERGYNQAALLADAVARRLQLPCAPQALRRVVDTPHQTALPRAQRTANMRGAFAVEPGARTSLAGHRVAVVDDVMTTGATLGEIARVLQAAGVVEVQAWVVARTPR
jgi:ComF family protein